MKDYWLLIWSNINGGEYDLLREHPLSFEEVVVETGAKWVERFPGDIVMLMEQEAIWDFNEVAMPQVEVYDLTGLMPRPRSFVTMDPDLNRVFVKHKLDREEQ